MKIAVDLRSLSSGSISGVENYTFNIIEHLLTLDKQNHYSLFYNSLHPRAGADLHFVNSETKRTRYPNKFLNAALKTGLIGMENLIGEFDCLFLPNFNHFTIAPDKKLIVTVHDLSFLAAPEFYDIKRRFWHKYLNIPKILSRADLVIAVSEYTKQDLVHRLGLPPEKIRVVYSGIDHSIFKPDSEEGQLRGIRNLYSLPGKFLLFLGTLEPRKNLIGLIKSFEQLDDPAYLIIAGKLGWKYGEIIRAINSSPKKNRIKYIGYIEEVHKPYIIKLSQALVYPSFYEGFGFPPLESMAVGVPVVASNVTSLPEVVGDSALLVNPYNHNEMAFALQEILSNNNLRELLINKGFEKARTYTWSRAAKEVLEGIMSLG